MLTFNAGLHTAREEQGPPVQNLMKISSTVLEYPNSDFELARLHNDAD
jgi:hypothetical protein